MNRAEAQAAWDEARASVQAMREVYEGISPQTQQAIASIPELVSAVQPATERAGALYREPEALPADEAQAWALLRRVHQYAASMEVAAQALAAHATDAIADDVGASGWIRALTFARNADRRIQALPYDATPTQGARPATRRGLGGAALVIVVLFGIALLDD